MGRGIYKQNVRLRWQIVARRLTLFQNCVPLANCTSLLALWKNRHDIPGWNIHQVRWALINLSLKLETCTLCVHAHAFTRWRRHSATRTVGASTISQRSIATTRRRKKWRIFHFNLRGLFSLLVLMSFSSFLMSNQSLLVLPIRIGGALGGGLTGNHSCQGSVKLQHFNSINFGDVKTLRLSGARFRNIRKLRDRMVFPLCNSLKNPEWYL